MRKRDLYKYLYAFSFGDGNLQKQGKHAFLRIKHISVNRDYIEWKRDILQSLTAVGLKDYEGHIINDPSGKTYYGKPYIQLWTRTHPAYTKVWERLYMDGHKVVDPHFLKFLDWEVMAIMYQDDGTVSDSKYSTHVTLCKQGLSYGDLEILRKAIVKYLGVMFNIHKSGSRYYRLDLICKDVPMFMENITPFILPSFQYKLRYSHAKHRLAAGEDIGRAA